MLRQTLQTETPPGRHKRSWSIPAYLLALALASTTPIAIVAGILGYHYLSDTASRTRRNLEDRLSLLRTAIELRIANVVEDLQLIALSPALQDGDLAGFRRHAVDGIALIGGIGMVLADRDGQELVSTRVPPGQPLPRRSDLEAQNRSIASGSPQVSDLRPASDGQMVVTVEVPVRVAGEIRYVLAVALSPKYLSEVMNQYVPPDEVGGIIDRRGILITRWPMPEGGEVVGRPTIPELRARVGQPAAFWIKTVSRSGASYYSSLLHSTMTGWSIALSLPRDAVDGPAHRAMFLFAALAAAVFLISLVFARFVAARLLAALGILQRHVMQLGLGRSVRTERSSVAEVNRMQHVLHRVGNDIAAAEQAIERERSLLRTTVEAMPIGVLLVTRDGNVSLVNEKMLSLWGADGLRSVDDLHAIARFRRDGSPYPVDEWPITRALQQGAVTEGEEVIHELAGGRRHFMISAVPVRDSEGNIMAAVAACYEVTELRTAMTRQQILLDEINHRVKNTLVTVQSVARLTLSSSDTLQDYANAFERRLLALSAAYNLLTDNNWEGAELQSIVERTLAPYSDPGRTLVAGPPINLTPKYTLAMAAAIQELSTNAAKYGALSCKTGSVAVSWSLRDDDCVVFSWIERDGPPVAKPTRRGFGTKLIQDILANDTGWTVTLDYLPAGLRSTMVIDLARAARRVS